MNKLITKDQEIEFNKCIIFPENLPNNTQDIKLVGDQCIDLQNLNLNIVKYDNVNGVNFIKNSNINKLVLNGNRWFIINNSTINDIYIQSEIQKLKFINTNIPNLHGKVDLINEIIIRE